MQKKQVVQFVLLLVLILALAGAYFGIRSFTEAEEEKKQQEEAAAVITLTSIDPEDVTQIAYNYDGTDYTFIKEDGQWKNKEDSETVLDQDVFGDFLKSACSITADAQVQPDDTEDYGFGKPLRRVSITTDSETAVLIFGSKNEMLSQYYVKKDGSSDVYLVEESVYTAFDKTAESFEAAETAADTETDSEADGEDSSAD